MDQHNHQDASQLSEKLQTDGENVKLWNQRFISGGLAVLIARINKQMIQHFNVKLIPVG